MSLVRSHLILSLSLLATASAVRAQGKSIRRTEVHPSCHAVNVTMVEGKPPDWHVTCTIDVNDARIYRHELPLAHPATRKEAFRAIERFFDKGFVEVLEKNGFTLVAEKKGKNK